MQRVILHIDMDYFYAAIEEREKPELRVKAVVVCMLSGRSELSGSVSTCNYIAREFGVRSGMPCSRAKKLNPEAVFLPVRKEFYTSVSDRIMEILRNYADPGENGDSFEQISIDEAFLDITDRTGGDFNLAFEIGMQIKKEIKEKENLTCSIGIGPNKLIAKMASSAKKPDGITVASPQDLEAFLWPLKVSKLWGIGDITARKLQEMGIVTVKDLAEYDVIKLISTFGKSRGTWLKQAAAGIDDSPLKERDGSEQIGRIATLPEDTLDPELIFPLLDRLAGDVIEKLDSRELSFRVVTVTVINSNFRMYTRSHTLNHAVSSKEILLEVSREILGGFLSENRTELRRVGIKVEGLQKRKGQKSLFDY
ncbi:DNA polymerase IV [Methanosarcina sp. 2.H.T.1A.6]|uniref:DNA polymerase IV n=1 Tax=unclassified Methanosarcina TaxID=2644672 RepID=UPI0006218DED|nr:MULTISPECIES: DNA polymerase IV [unclassified Methanosarcina]KKG13008.1 DNA polymerase IV [Methanosarcina sp. 2.H.T.1A.15]KKG14226.1 DNA polymerase IV [Methanosarcina sp. 2.H.T.1A.3]KKG19716.1 DNA polymerase IV [Methanosarcina sp. 2.H.T.1A.6]KKG27103.1 DNA polymerase IV [Methanosarcina sp. 2.H.T.1A.8]